MKISKENIEACMLDYMEGNLGPVDTAELMAFLAENPEYEAWLSAYETGTWPEARLSGVERSLLKRDFVDIPAITAGNFEEFCIAASEGILDRDDLARLDAYAASHPGCPETRDLYGKLKLRPDLSIVYPGKSQLKRLPIRRVAFRYISLALGVAASVAILIMLTGRKPGPDALDGTATTLSEAGRPAPLPSPVTTPAQSEEQESTPRPLAGGVPVKATVSPAPDHEAVTDTRHERISLAALEPIRPGLQQTAGQSPVVLKGIPGRTTRSPRAAQNPSRKISDREPSAFAFLGSVAKRLDFWNAAETALSGFNYLTESRLSLSRSTDENGKLNGLALETRQFTISGNKVR